MTQSIDTQSASLPRSTKKFYWVFSLAFVPTLLLRLVFYVGHVTGMRTDVEQDTFWYLLFTGLPFIVMYLAQWMQARHNGSYVGCLSLLLAFVADVWFFDRFPIYLIVIFGLMYVLAYYCPPRFAEFKKVTDTPLDGLTEKEQRYALTKAYILQKPTPKEHKWVRNAWIIAVALNVIYAMATGRI